MWTFLATALGAALKLGVDKKWGVLMSAVSIAMVIGAGAYAKTTITKNKEDIVVLKNNQTSIAATMQVMQATMLNVNDTMKDLKTTMQQVDKTNRDVQKSVVDIYRDVYEIKLKQQGG